MKNIIYLPYIIPNRFWKKKKQRRKPTKEESITKYNLNIAWNNQKIIKSLNLDYCIRHWIWFYRIKILSKKHNS